jgi:NitT/TauT family transport system substrate-binding protein
MVDSRHTTRRRILEGTAAGVAGLAGCIGGSNSGGNGSNGSQAGRGNNRSGSNSNTNSKSTKLAAAHYPTIPESVSIQVGIEKGIYKKHGVTIENVTSFGGGGTTIRGIVTGGIGMGATALPALVQAHLRGASIYLSGLILTQPDIDFHVKPDSSIKSIQDLKGKTVAVSNPGSSSEAVLIRSLNKATNISFQDVNVMHAGGLGEAITAMQQGAAEVTWNIPFRSVKMINANESRRVWWARKYAPNITQYVVAIGGAVKRNNPQLAKSLISAQIETYDWIKNNTKQAAKVWANNVDISTNLAFKSLKVSQPNKMFGIEPKKTILNATADTMIKQGLIDSRPPWDQILWQEPLPEKYRISL